MSADGGPDAASVRRRLVTLRRGLTGTVTFLGAALGVIFLLVPSWRPLSRDKIEASVSVPTVESGVSVRDWADRQFSTRARADAFLNTLDPRPITRSQLAAPGTVVYVRLQVDGFQHRAIKLRARIYGTDTRKSPPPGNTDIGQEYPTDHLSIDAPSRSSVQLLFLDDLTYFKGLFVRVEAYDDNGILAYADSGPISKGVSKPPTG